MINRKRRRITTSNNLLQHVTRAKPSFTLVELLLYMGLVAIFMTAVTYFAWDVSLGNIKARVYQEVQENFRFASRRLQIDIRNAGGIDAAGSNFGVNLTTNPGTRLRLLGSVPYPTEFRIDQGVLQVKQGASDWIALTSSVVEITNLTFTNLTDTGSENIHFILTVRYRNPSGRSEWEKEETVETCAQLR